ncbi:hypothetical protein O6H91_02G055800 [Diphasiastrum complanatum]|uniref:Uncharacterized protein n=1 Tax=Diphasiastrum complanatum TaxID=34168 RepID=A0ACC2EFP5_DIPCM|nr:hypothetical protein O6H91_02G055800 [Diphasiastrum complanatum]
MYPLQVFMMFLSATVAGYVAWRASRLVNGGFESYTQEQDYPTCSNSRSTGLKRKREESDANKDPFREQSNEVGFTCAICLDTMKEATSTVCGHIFCRCCISEVIKACKSCPTCRKKLNSSLIHRVYIENMI